MRRGEILRRQAVAAADRHAASSRAVRRDRLRQGRHHVEIKRLARRARLLGVLQHRDRPHRRAAARQGTRRRRTGGTAAPAARRPSRRRAAAPSAVSRAVSAPEPIRTIDALGIRRRRHSRTAGIAGRSARRTVHRRLHDGRARARRTDLPSRAPERTCRGCAPCRGRTDAPGSSARRAMGAHQIVVDHRADVGVARAARSC